MAQGDRTIAQGTPNTSLGGSESSRPRSAAGDDAGAGNGDELKQQINILRDDFGNLRTDLMSVLESLLEIGKGKTGAAKDKVVEGGKKAMDVTEGHIKDRPFAAILIAMVLGMILSALIRKSGS